jgi:hypothetical protein
MVCSRQMPRSGPDVPRAFRILAVLLAIAAMLCVSAASVSPAHSHLNDQADHCDVCVTAHLAVQQVALVQVVHALELQSVLPVAAQVQRFESRQVLTLLTRGPPSSL